MENQELKEFIDIYKLKEIINEYLSNKFNKKIEIKEELNIKYINNKKTPIIRFYIENYLKKTKVTIFLNEHDISCALEEYLEKNGCTFNHFKYIGGTKKSGKYIDTDIPYIEGIELFYDNKKRLSRK